jgi:hypothetical protein
VKVKIITSSIPAEEKVYDDFAKGYQLSLSGAIFRQINCGTDDVVFVGGKRFANNENIAGWDLAFSMLTITRKKQRVIEIAGIVETIKTNLKGGLNEKSDQQPVVVTIDYIQGMMEVVSELSEEQIADLGKNLKTE